MAKRSSNPLSDAEWKVMKIVWQKKSCAARDVYVDAGEDFGWSPSTVRTLLSRLLEKRFLKTKQIGNCLVYSPVQSMAKSLFRAADDLLDKTLAGKAGPVLSYMVKKSELTREDRQELLELLTETKEEKES